MDIKQFQADWTELEQIKPLLEEIPTAPLAHRIQPYLRSKAFTSQIGINSLIAAAAPIFFLTEKIELSETPLDLTQFHEDMVHEIIAFETQAKTLGYHTHIVLAARYILGLWVDETILNTRWGRQTGWGNQLLLVDNTQSELNDNKSFFLILKHCLQEPATYIDLLELLYLCLSLGFEGEYRHMERGHIQLAKVYDNLYHCIQKQRGEVSKELDIKMAEEVSQENGLAKLLIRSLVVFAAIVTPITAYIFMNNQLKTDLTTLNKTIVSSLEETL